MGIYVSKGTFLHGLFGHLQKSRSIGCGSWLALLPTKLEGNYFDLFFGFPHLEKKSESIPPLGVVVQMSSVHQTFTKYLFFTYWTLS